MSRGNTKTRKRETAPDPVYKSRLVTRLINRVMQDGKKSVARKQVYEALELLPKDQGEPVELFQKALENIKPSMEVRPRRVGGASYQVPTPVRGDRKEALAIRWLIMSAAARPNKEYRSFGAKIAAEIQAALKNEGGAIKKREDTLKMAEANKAFAHFRW